MEELITVAVAVYNAEKYLSKAVDSIISQDYENLEILLVDDGSKDKSPDICDTYAKKDKRVRVIHQANKGLCEVRNRVIKEMKGSYLMFVDNDDWVDKSIVSYLYTKMVNYDLDMASCYAIDYDEETGVGKENKKGNEKIFNAYEGIKDFYYERKFTFDGIQCKMYRKEVLKDIIFTPGRSVDDTLTTPKIMDKCHKMGYFDVGLYHYLVRNNSMCRSTYTSKTIDKVLAYVDNYDLIKSKYPDVLPLLEHNIYASAATNLLRLKVLKLENKFIDDKKYYDQLLKKYKPIYSKERMFVNVFYYLNKFPFLVDLVCYLFNEKIRNAVGV